jgi:arylsulfatase A-like enzyme
MVGETPNINRIGNEGAILKNYVAMQSCTSGRTAFVTGRYRTLLYEVRLHPRERVRGSYGNN